MDTERASVLCEISRVVVEFNILGEVAEAPENHKWPREFSKTCSFKARQRQVEACK